LSIPKEAASVTDLAPFTALGAANARSQSFGALTIRETPDLALASFSLGRGGLQPSLMGMTLPGPGDWATWQGISAFWTAPNQWMIETEGQAEDDFAEALKQAVPDATVSEQTDGFVCFEISSTRGAAPILSLLMKLVNIDLVRFGSGRAMRTVFEHMPVFVIRRTEDRLALIGMRSAAGSIWHALSLAAERLQKAR
jgi:heterotetrameric sarcosine oxidase gamma subunit